ncbi:HNH endonuclease [Aureimonas sp. AU4]|jgi:hypothetical protein|uniref:HNH endonuclease n=1 Tax=Aureimonas sp. AU4 TaxID=1638163 RepID=UPI001FCD6D5B|nr:HNH endonuclease [Aureimonas sp. AU4]
MGRQRKARPHKDNRWVEGEEEASRLGDCWLCARPLGARVEWHHPLPKSRGGRDTVPVHPICHRAMHASFTNRELADISARGEKPSDDPRLHRFLAWIDGKPPDFHAPTRAAR